MLEFFKEKIWRRRLCAKLKKQCQPRPEFLNLCRSEFIEKLCQEIPAQDANVFSSFAFGGVLKYSAVFAIVVLFLGSGAVVYADKADVNYDNPLYSFKRVGEAVRIKLAPAQKEVMLHAEFAERRAVEIKAINEKVQTPLKGQTFMSDTEVRTSTKETKKEVIKAETDKQIKEREQKITKLRVQMRKEMDSVVAGVQTEKIEKPSARKLCDSVSRLMEEDKEDKGEESKEREKSREKFKSSCQELMAEDGD